jgi:hypothetical protein
MLILTWILGDGIKAFYFTFASAPTQFLGSACFQLSLDVALALQYLYLYRNPSFTKLQDDNDPFTLTEELREIQIP